MSFISKKNNIYSSFTIVMANTSYHCNLTLLFNVGYVYDTWNNYRIAYYTLAAIVFFSAGILGLVPLTLQQKKNKDKDYYELS